MVIHRDIRTEKSLTRTGKFRMTETGWQEIPSFGSRKDISESEAKKALVTEGGNILIFEKLEKRLREGPTGNESTLYDKVADPVPRTVYDLLNAYRDTTPMIANQLFDSMRNPEMLMTHLGESSSYGIASGRKPSGPCHFGHKLVIETIQFFQRNSAQIFVPLADTEAGLDPKIRSPSQYKYFIADNLLDWGASGLNLDAAYVYLQSEEMRVMNISYRAARGLTLSCAIDVFGRETMVDEMNFLFASITQVGDILLPQHPDFGKRHSFMLSGSDQDGNMAIALTLSKSIIDSYTLGTAADERLVQTVPSSLYIRSISNLEGNKESASEPETTIYLGPSRNRYVKTETGKELESIDRLTLSDRIADMYEKVDRFSASNQSSVIEAIARRQSVFTEFAGVMRPDTESFKSITADTIQMHHEKRTVVYEYAILLAIQSRRLQGTPEALAEIVELEKAGKERLPNFDPDKKPSMPLFWNVPDEAYVQESQKKVKTTWFNMIADVADSITL